MAINNAIGGTTSALSSLQNQQGMGTSALMGDIGSQIANLIAKDAKPKSCVIERVTVGKRHANVHRPPLIEKRLLDTDQKSIDRRTLHHAGWQAARRQRLRRVVLGGERIVKMVVREVGPIHGQGFVVLGGFCPTQRTRQR